MLKDCETRLYLKGYLDFSPWSSFYSREKKKPISKPLDKSSAFDDIIYYWEHASDSDIEEAIKNPSYSAIFAMKIVASSWLVLLTFLSSNVGILESAIHRFEDLDPKSGSRAIAAEITRLRTQMANVNRLRRFSWWYIYHMKSNLEAVEQFTGDPSSHPLKNYTHGGPSPSLALGGRILGDLEVIYDRLLLIQRNIDSLMPIVIGANSLLESQQTSLDTKYVLRLTILALVFVPVSSTTGFFSMADRYLPGQPDSWVVAFVCISLLCIVFLLAFRTVAMEKLRTWSTWRRKEGFTV